VVYTTHQNDTTFPFFFWAILLKYRYQKKMRRIYVFGVFAINCLLVSIEP